MDARLDAGGAMPYGLPRPRARDPHRFVCLAWWEDPDMRVRVAALVRRARPIQIVTCTAGGEHLGEVGRSAVAQIDQLALPNASSGRPLVRWLFVERGPSTSVDAMVEQLACRGVEVERRGAPRTASGSIAGGRRAALAALATLDLGDRPIVLLLDDDLAFDALVQGPQRVELGCPWPWLAAVWAFHETQPHVDVALGGVTGAPPLPASSSLATNLLDLGAALQGGVARRDAARWSEVDAYYDLSPFRSDDARAFALDEAPRGAALLDALLEQGVLARPLVATPTTIARARPMPIVRGGNTIVFEPRFLVLPHPRCRLGELVLRRADTVWVQAATSLNACRVAEFPLPLRHLRDKSAWSESGRSRWCKRMLADLGGVGVYRGIERWRAERPWHRAAEIVGARNAVLDMLEQRRVAVLGGLALAARRLAGLRLEPPELDEVAATIEAGASAAAALDLGSAVVERALVELSESLEVGA